MRRFLPLLLLLATPLAHAQVRHCTAPDGTEIFTDRRCEELGAVEQRAPPTRPTPGLYRQGCSRNLRDLAFELRLALDGRDVNRLAGLYHWAGMSGTAAYTVMDRLEAIARKPLVDIVPVYAGNDAGGNDLAGDGHPQPTMRRAPVGLRLEQTLANGSTPSHIVLALHRHLGCWWVSL